MNLMTRPEYFGQPVRSPDPSGQIRSSRNELTSAGYSEYYAIVQRFRMDKEIIYNGQKLL